MPAKTPWKIVPFSFGFIVVRPDGTRAALCADEDEAEDIVKSHRPGLRRNTKSSLMKRIE